MPIYGVEVVVPGEATWCMRQRASVEGRLARLTARELTAMPAVRSTYFKDGGYHALVLSWIEVSAENAWAAVGEVARIAESALPDVHGEAVSVRIAADLQDPDAERRRPLGA
jgi:hypothetical protein